MKKIKNEQKLIKKAMEIGIAFAKKQGYEDFAKGISDKEKVECIYRLLVDVKQITPLSPDLEDGPNMKHKLAIWISRLLPPDHELLQ